LSSRGGYPFHFEIQKGSLSMKKRKSSSSEVLLESEEEDGGFNEYASQRSCFLYDNEDPQDGYLQTLHEEEDEEIPSKRRRKARTGEEPGTKAGAESKKSSISKELFEELTANVMRLVLFSNMNKKGKVTKDKLSKQVFQKLV